MCHDMFKIEDSLKGFLYCFYYKVKTELDNLDFSADGLSGHAGLEDGPYLAVSAVRGWNFALQLFAGRAGPDYGFAYCGLSFFFVRNAIDADNHLIMMNSSFSPTEINNVSFHVFEETGLI